MSIGCSSSFGFSDPFAIGQDKLKEGTIRGLTELGKVSKENIVEYQVTSQHRRLLFAYVCSPVSIHFMLQGPLFCSHPHANGEKFGGSVLGSGIVGAACCGPLHDPHAEGRRSRRHWGKCCMLITTRECLTAQILVLTCRVLEDKLTRALQVLIKGETDHYDMIKDAATSAIMQVIPHAKGGQSGAGGPCGVRPSGGEQLVACRTAT